MSENNPEKSNLLVNNSINSADSINSANSTNSIDPINPIANIIVQALNLSALSDARITQLGGGITNLNYRIEANQEIFVLRVGGKGTQMLGIDRAREHAATAIAADLGIGAEVVYCDAAADLMITRFISGQVLTPALAGQSDTLQKIAACMRGYHDGPDFSGSFSPFEVARSYHHLAIDHGVNFPSTVRQALDIIDRIEQAMGPLENPKPCHNDLLAANFIDDGERIRLIDWEYAAMGDPFFDLGNFAVNQELSQQSCQQLLEFYFGELRPKDFARLELMRLTSDLRESFWGFLQSGISTIDFDFREYAVNHLDRFLQNAADRQFANLLKQCSLRD